MGPMFPRVCLLLITSVSAAVWHWAEQRGAGKSDWRDVAVTADGSSVCAITATGDVAMLYDGGWYHEETWKNLVAVALSSDFSKIFTVAAGDIDGMWIWKHHYTSETFLYWTIDKEYPSPPPYGATQWSDVAVSSNGMIIAVVVNNGNIFISKDGGGLGTWQEDISVGSTKEWSSIAMSDDGSKMVASAYGEKIWISTDTGDIWEEATSSPSENWLDVAISSDGSKILAAGDSLYTSSDGGTTWVPASTVGTRQWFQWRGVAMSSDGSKMAACGYGEIWTSMDTGDTWLREANFDTDAYLYPGSGNDVNSGMITKVAISSDGSTMVAVAASPGYVLIREPGTTTSVTITTNTTTASTRTTSLTTATSSTGTETTATATSSTVTVVTTTSTTRSTTTLPLLDEETSAGSAVSALGLVSLVFYPWIC